MEPISLDTTPLVVIVGPTASGKTSLSIELAKKFGGEIICADSRTIYKGMDIGTAKPTYEERAAIPHWGLDLVEPGEHFTVADFKRYAQDKIKEIRSRGHIPFLVGGSGMYVDSVVFNYTFGNKSDPHVRDSLGSLSVDELLKYCYKHNVTLPENYKNKRYLIRAIEQKDVPKKSNDTLIENVIVVGIMTDKDILRKRIEERAGGIFESGVVNEAISLGTQYGWDNEAMTGNIYPLVHSYYKKELTVQEMKEKFITLDWRLAKRQMTWMRRNKYIQWFGLEEARVYLMSLLAKV